MREGELVAGRYRLLRRIGAGAMGTVWAVRHELLDRDLALKICTFGDGERRASADKRALFLREVRIVGRLRHPNVVDIADAGDAGVDGLYLAMELLEGKSLAQRIAEGPLPPQEALAVAAEVCRGLVAAHHAGVVHRDLKPENIFLSRGPAGGVVPKLLDFGVSSARDLHTARRSEAFGTPAYMSPEQALGEGGVDHRTDVWAMGVVLYEMVTGRLPFEAPSYLALLPLIIEGPTPPLPSSVPAEVRTVIAGCLAKSPDDRYPTASALLDAIDRAMDALPPTESTPTRSAFFIETPPPPEVRGPLGLRPIDEDDGDGGPLSGPSARTARRGLALAILAVPLAIGVAAVTMGGPQRSPQTPPGSMGEGVAMRGPERSPAGTMGDGVTMGAPERVPQPPPSPAPPSVTDVASAPVAVASAAPRRITSTVEGRSSAAPVSQRTPPPARSSTPRAPKKVTGVDNAGF